MAKQDIFKDYLSSVFIETGSFKGDGIQGALDAGFERVISIEVSKQMYDTCMERFKGEKRLELYLGDSLNLLSTILETVLIDSTFWLDAHPGDPGTGKGKKAVPLMEELDAIKRHSAYNKLKHTILVDDMKYFRKPKGWNGVRKDQIIKKIMEIGNYNISYADGTVKDDILIATI